MTLGFSKTTRYVLFLIAVWIDYSFISDSDILYRFTKKIPCSSGATVYNGSKNTLA